MASGGFEARQAIAFTAALVMTSTGLVLFTCSGDAYAVEASQGFQALEEVGVSHMIPHTNASSGELQCLNAPACDDETAK